MSNDEKLIVLGVAWFTFIVGVLLHSKYDRNKVKADREKTDKHNDLEGFKLPKISPMMPWKKTPKACEEHFNLLPPRKGVLGLMVATDCDFCKKVIK